MHAFMHASMHPCMHPWTFFGHHSDMFWAPFGHVLGTIWTCFGHHLDMFWAALGRNGKARSRSLHNDAFGFVLPPKIEELPPAEKEEKIEKAGEKIKGALTRAIVEPAKNFGSKFKKEDSDKPKEAEDIVKALPKEDRKEVEKTRAEVEKEFLDKYDTNKDGKLSAMEITLMNMKKRGEI